MSFGILRSRTRLLLLLGILVSSFNVAWDRFDPPDPSRLSVETAELPEVATFRRPFGDEIVVSVARTGPKKALLTVTNQSNNKVFLPYLPGRPDGHAFFAIVGLEKLNKETGQFEEWEGTDFGPGLHPLDAGRSYKWGIRVLEHTRYRVNLRYVTDEDLVDLMARCAQSERNSEKWRRACELLSPANLDELIHNVRAEFDL